MKPEKEKKEPEAEIKLSKREADILFQWGDAYIRSVGINVSNESISLREKINNSFK